MQLTTEYLDKKFKSLDQKLDTKFGQIDIKFQHIDAKFENIDKKFAQIDQKLGSFDKKFGQFDKKFTGINGKFNRLYKFLIDNMVTKVEFNQELDRVRNGMATKTSMEILRTAVDNLAKRVNDNYQESKAHTHQITTLTEWVGRASKKIGVDYNP
jgi:archaellum component FlaC